MPRPERSGRVRRQCRRLSSVVLPADTNKNGTHDENDVNQHKTEAEDKDEDERRARRSGRDVRRVQRVLQHACVRGRELQLFD
ncbi:hypothetical protein BN2476_240213 [Paraburkholderia piptadeniae]|uniref:Uncharacterized protein n=1 Tax=Paraburkholderia piptadeniae TaxID=1701573 RepID=A0A1N7RZG2_9BURK|nr:hypothetical protein BN2476_240213 [Paraburkholderia piptadeniae]